MSEVDTSDHIRNMVDTLADQCLVVLRQSNGSLEPCSGAVHVVKTALIVMPYADRSTFAHRVLERIVQEQYVHENHPVLVEMVLWEQITDECLFSDDAALQRRAARVLLAVRLEKPHSCQFEEMLKQKLSSLTGARFERAALQFLCLHSEDAHSEHYSLAFRVVAQELVRRRPNLILRMARTFQNYG